MSEPTRERKRVAFVCVEDANRSQVPDPRHLSPERFREVRDLIEAKVKELLAGL